MLKLQTHVLIGAVKCLAQTSLLPARASALPADSSIIRCFSSGALLAQAEAAGAQSNVPFLHQESLSASQEKLHELPLFLLAS